MAIYSPAIPRFHSEPSKTVQSSPLIPCPSELSALAAPSIAKPCYPRRGISRPTNICPCGNGGFPCMWRCCAPLETRVYACLCVTTQALLAPRSSPWTRVCLAIPLLRSLKANQTLDVVTSCLRISTLHVPERRVGIPSSSQLWTATPPRLRSTATQVPLVISKTTHPSTGDTTIPENQSPDKRASAIPHGRSSALLPPRSKTHALRSPAEGGPRRALHSQSQPHGLGAEWRPRSWESNSHQRLHDHFPVLLAPIPPPTLNSSRGMCVANGGRSPHGPHQEGKDAKTLAGTARHQGLGWDRWIPFSLGA
jgi:hypothetical protein